MELTFELISAILGGTVIGAICGALSLAVGIIKKKRLLGIIGFIVSLSFGILMAGVLHFPAFLSIFPSAIMAGIILLLTRNAK